MIALRLVVDTNILVSAALKPEGLQRTVLVNAMAKPGPPLLFAGNSRRIQGGLVTSGNPNPHGSA